MILINTILSLPRIYKRLISVGIDILFICFSFWGAFITRLDDVGFLNQNEYWQVLIALVLSTVVLFTRVGLYRAILRYLSVHALLTIVISCLISALLLIVFGYFYGVQIPRSIPVIYAAFLILLSGGARLFIRLTASRQKTKLKERVIIYGAGDSGRQLVNLLRQGHEYHPVAFIDDEKALYKTVVNGLCVFKAKKLDSLIIKMRVKKILLAIPSATRSQRKKIINSLVGLPVEVKSIPHFEALLNGNATIDQLQNVPIEDLLGRDPVTPQHKLLQANIKNKVVMVTGAGGSIGSELCRQIVAELPLTIILFERSEYALYKIEQELTQYITGLNGSIKIIPLLGCVQHIERLKSIMSSFKVNTVYHAAAYKHVPLVEFNVIEGIKNNVFGTYNAAKAAIECHVESFVLISTDKAVRPTNVMGTTKRLAELGLQALAAKEQTKENGTRFCMVRFGNVLGSSGSVIPLFKKQIFEGGPLTITHPDITRYFMTIPEAAQLVIQAGAMGKGGDVFVLDMGEPVKITDLAENLIQLSGLKIKNEENPLGDIEIQFTGLRPGEKLYEELLIGEDVSETAHGRIMTANESFLPLKEYEEILAKLDGVCSNFEHDLIRDILLSTPTGFNPTDGIGDLVWNEKVDALKIKI